MAQCLNCKQPYRPGAHFCGYCRAALTRSCPNCGGDNRIQARYCVYCRTELARPCPACGWLNRSTARFCQHCRAPLTPVGMPVSITPFQPPHPYMGGAASGHQTGMLPPQTLLHGRYLIIGKLADGGMGAVYQATNAQRPGQKWAIKEMSESKIKPHERAETINNFRREADTLRRLNHINLPKVEEVFENQGRHYMVMELIDGQTLHSYLERHGGGPLPEQEVLGWTAQLCDVLEYLHNQSPPIIYRDLKPQNVMIEQRGGCLKLIDFGIVRFYQASKVKDTAALGTPGYAPPEQFGKAQTDARSDIFALAAMLHHLLTGRDPTNNTLFDFPPARQINPALSAKVEAALTQALQPGRDKRPSDIAEFRSLLGIKAGKPQPAAKPKPAASSQSPQQPLTPRTMTSTRRLDFGVVPRGQQPTRRLQVHSATALVGSVAASHAWLQVSPDYLKGHNTDIDVTVDTHQLPFERSVWTTPNLAGDFWLRLQPYVRRYWWAMLIGLFIPYLNLVVVAPFAILALLALLQALIWWTLLHASWLVQQPRQHTAQVEVQSGGDSETVDVAIEVTPDRLENRWRWGVAVGLVMAEAALAWWLLSATL